MKKISLDPPIVSYYPKRAPNPNYIRPRIRHRAGNLIKRLENANR